MSALPNRATFELDGTDADFEGASRRLEGFALDALYELHRLVEDHEGLRAKVTIEWEGTY